MNNIKEKNAYLYLSLICLVLTCTTKYFVNPVFTKILPFVSVFFAILCTNKNVAIKKSFLGFIFFYILFIIGSFKSDLFMQTIGDILSFGLCLILVICLNKKYIEVKKILMILKYFCIFFSVMTIIEFFNFDFVYSILSKLYDSSTLRDIMSWKNSNSFYTGIFPDRAPCAFFSCVLIGLALINIINERSIKKNKKSIVEFFIGLFSLLLTAKRGLFLATLISISVVFYSHNKARGKPIYKIIITEILVFIIFYLFLLNTSSAEVLLTNFFDNDNLFTGRLSIYNFMISMFQSNPLFGVGTGFINHALGLGGHNIYLNVLSENGLLGLVCFSFSLICILLFSIRRVKYDINDKDLTFKNLYGIFIQVFFIVYGLSGNPLYDNYILYMYFLGIIACYMNKENNNN